MKKLLFVSLIIYPFSIFSQSVPRCVDKFFEGFDNGSLVFEAELSKFEFDSSEPILLTAYIRNSSKSDTSNSVSLIMLADGGGYNFSLINMNSGYVETIADNELEGFKVELNFLHKIIAPGERVKAFTIDLSEFLMHKPLFPMSNVFGLTRIYTVEDPKPAPRYVSLGRGLYQFIWYAHCYGKRMCMPLFFEIK